MLSGSSSSKFSIYLRVSFLEDGVEVFILLRTGSSPEDDSFSDEISMELSEHFFDLYLNLPDNRFLMDFGVDLGEGEIDEDGFFVAICLVFILGEN